MKLLNYALFIALASTSYTMAFAEQHAPNTGASDHGSQQDGMPSGEMTNTAIGQQGSLEPSEIKEAQEALKDKGYSVDVDGVFGEKTAAAVKEFQKDNNIEATGILDELTLVMLVVNFEDSQQGQE